MPTCHKCRGIVSKVYDCDHTGYQSYCRECYEDLHYELTEA